MRGETEGEASFARHHVLDAKTGRLINGDELHNCGIILSENILKRVISRLVFHFVTAVFKVSLVRR